MNILCSFFKGVRGSNSKRGCLILVIFLSLALSSGIQAQDFSYPSGNAEYITTNQFQVANGAQFSSTDPFIDLSMECLAANGYGQWTCTSAPGSFTYVAGQ